MDLRLATFNLENVGVRPDEDIPAVREWLPRHVRALRHTLRRLDADALAFQEVLDPALLDELLDGLGYEHRVLSEPTGSSPLRMGVAARHRLTGARSVAGRVELSHAKPSSGLEFRMAGPFNRPALEVRWEAPGLPVVLLVVHWKAKIPTPPPSEPGAGPHRWASFAEVGEGRLMTEVLRTAQAVELRRVVDGHLAADPEARLAVLGDFNDTLESEGLRILRGDARGARAPHLVPAELVPACLAVPEDQRFSQIYRGRRELLDHILLSPSLFSHLEGTRILNEDLIEAEGDTFPDPWREGSDHAPVMAVLRA